MNSPFKLIWVKAAIAFLIPLLVTLAAALDPYIGADSAQPTVIGWIVILCAPLVAGLSALKAFLSTDYADHKDEQTAASGIPPLGGPAVPGPTGSAGILPASPIPGSPVSGPASPSAEKFPTQP